MRCSARASARCGRRKRSRSRFCRNQRAPLSRLADASVPGLTFEEHLQPLRTDVRVIATFLNGDAAITDAPYGRGRAILIGSFPAAAFEQDPTKNRNAGALLPALTGRRGHRA